MITGIVIGVVMTAVIALIAVASFLLGGLLGVSWIADDAEKRLKGKAPIDEFWRKRGMR